MRGSPRRRKIAFDAGHLNLRGTDVALFDYADCAETILGHRSIILAPADSDLSALGKFRERFHVFLYRDRREQEMLIEGVDLYYLQVHGSLPAELPPKPPQGRRGIHCVFTADAPHGEVYATISRWVSRERGPAVTSAIHTPPPAVPYMVRVADTDEDLRLGLGIPVDAFVLGRHGGPSTFNIPWVRPAVAAALDARADLHFVFLNTPPFLDHPRAHFLAGTHDLVEKRLYINTCDAMLHARAEGETFGLAVAEFSVCNKPVITWSGGLDRSHIEVLGERGVYYDDANDLLALLSQWTPAPGDWDAYSAEFAPEPVMAQFSRVFLGEEPAFATPPAAQVAVPSA